MNEAFTHYAGDSSHAGDPEPGSHVGSAGGAPCGDLVRISLRIAPGGEGRLEAVRIATEGCASARAAAAATAELICDATLAQAALLGPTEIEAELGGLSSIGRHGAELAADALHRALGAAAVSGQPLLDPPEPGRPERVLVAMSGGVDSAAAAHLEASGDREVFAVTLELWSDPENDGEASCCSPQAVRLARGVAHDLGIPHLTVDLRERFRAGVVEPFLRGYEAGVTPNPCVGCNGRVRLEPMIRIAERLGAAGLATGHYARVADDGEGPLLAPARDEAKDQTYMLAALPTDELPRMRFPLAPFTKPEVRSLAEQAGLPVASRPESQDLCFLAGVGKSGFLARHGGLGRRRGAIVDSAGRRLGDHEGHHTFTVGQRRGIGLGAPEPLYVLATDARANTVTVGPAAELDRDRVLVRDATLHRGPERIDAVKLRYRSAALPCRVTAGDGGEVHVELGRSTRRPAPGQTAVFFAGDLIVGHGTIA